jgi:hypothetical protein
VGQDADLVALLYTGYAALSLEHSVTNKRTRTTIMSMSSWQRTCFVASHLLVARRFND